LGKEPHGGTRSEIQFLGTIRAITPPVLFLLCFVREDGQGGMSEPGSFRAQHPMRSHACSINMYSWSSSLRSTIYTFRFANEEGTDIDEERERES